MAQVGDALTAGRAEASVREHRAIAAAILARDPPAAAAHMRAHLERAAGLALQRCAADHEDEAPSQAVTSAKP